MLYEVQLILKNKYGVFNGKKAIISQEQYNALLQMSKTFYTSGGFELTCDDDSFVIFPPDIVGESILIINKKISEQSEENKEENVQE